MTTNELTGDALTVLRAAGWHEGRRTDTISSLRTLKDLRFSVSPYAAAALSELGGLTLQPEDGFDEYVRFDVIVATRNTSMECFDAIQDVLKNRICPIAAGRDYIFCVSSEGRIYLLHDQFTNIYMRPNLSAGINLLCGKKSNRGNELAIDWYAVPKDVRDVLFPSGV